MEIVEEEQQRGVLRKQAQEIFHPVEEGAPPLLRSQALPRFTGGRQRRDERPDLSRCLARQSCPDEVALLRVTVEVVGQDVGQAAVRDCALGLQAPPEEAPEAPGAGAAHQFEQEAGLSPPAVRLHEEEAVLPLGSLGQ